MLYKTGMMKARIELSLSRPIMGGRNPSDTIIDLFLSKIN